jgi:DHA2 family multidrug resistance protein
MVVGPRGIGAFIGAPVVGFLGSRVDPRKLMTAGFVTFAICAFIFSTVNLEIGPYTLLVPILVTGFALSFAFVPMATMAISTISNQEMGNATGLFNMLRNIGGSVGIAMASTAIVRRADLHQTYLAEHLSPSAAILQQKSAAITAFLGHQIGTGGARPGSFGLIYGQLVRQAALLAYVDVFRWTVVLAVICTGCTWFFRKPPKNHVPPPGLH